MTPSYTLESDSAVSVSKSRSPGLGGWRDRNLEVVHPVSVSSGCAFLAHHLPQCRVDLSNLFNIEWVIVWMNIVTTKVWCWRRLLRVPWTVRRSTQSILKKISPGCSLEGLMLKLKLLMQRADSLAKTLMLGKMEGRRRMGWRRMRWLDGITKSMGMSLGELGSWWWTGRLGSCSSWGHKKSDMTETELNWIVFLQYVLCFRH